MGEPTRGELIATIARLGAIVDGLYSRYCNDVTPDRATEMERLHREGFEAQQAILNRLPFDVIERAAKRHPRQDPDHA